MIKKNLIVVVLFEILFSFFAFSKEYKIYYTKEKPKIDGKFDDIYKNFTIIKDFYQVQDNWGKPMSERTFAYLGFDNKNIYFAIKCYDSNPKRIRATLCKRENIRNNEIVLIFFDTFLTRRKSFVFGLNPFGIQLDGIRDDENHRDDMDFSWDTLWYSEGKVYDWGYFVEARIPFRSLRFNSSKNIQKWGFIIARIIPGKGESGVSVNIDRSKRGFLSQENILILDKKLISGKNIEILPTFTGLKNKSENPEPKFGVSFKYGFTSNSTLDLTINPDFSHIEADEGMIDINQRYALYYPEKRPFFLEAKEMFDMPVNLFYSRRIVSPQWGLKFTGRFDKFGVGIISARDTSSFEDIWDVEEGGEDNALVNVVRLKYEIKDTSHIGFFFTNKNWNNKNNYVLSTDSFVKFGNFGFRMMGSFSKTEKKEGSVLFSELSYSKNDFSTFFGYSQISPEFDSQLGFIKKQSYRRAYFYAGYNFYPQKRYMKSIRPSIFINKEYDWETGHIIESNNKFSIKIRSFNNTYVNLTVSKGTENFENIDFDKFDIRSSFFSDLNKYVGVFLFFRFGDSINYDPDNPYLGYSIAGALELNLNLFNRSSLSFSYNNYYFYNEAGGELQYKMNIYRIRNVYMFTKELSSRLIYEFNDYYKSHFISFLMSYELNPGSVVYFGVSSEYLKEKNVLQNNKYSIFLKLSYLLRL